MIRYFATLAAAGILAGCVSQNANLESEVVNSIPFDTTSCADLTAQRNALASRYGVPPTAAREQRTESRLMGVGSMIPETRSRDAVAQGQAIGTIDAMNRSLTRRACNGQNAAS